VRNTDIIGHGIIYFYRKMKFAISDCGVPHHCGNGSGPISNGARQANVGGRITIF
jgi:hypothetical protein